MELKFYRCAHCGNVAFKAVDSGRRLVCCGDEMQELKAGQTDGALEKHVPVVTREGDRVTIQVGSVIHPMLPEHYIQFIAALDGDRVIIQQLMPGDKPVLELVTDREVTAYELCNLHGFWTGK